MRRPVLDRLATGFFILAATVGVFTAGLNAPLFVVQLAQGDSTCDLVLAPAGLYIRPQTVATACTRSGLSGATVVAIDGVELSTLQDSSRFRGTRGLPGSTHVWRVLRDGTTTEVTLKYQLGALADWLAEAGNRRADLVVIGLTLLAAASQVGLQILAAWLLFRIGRSFSVARILSGGVIAATLGLALAPSQFSVWGRWGWTACAVMSLMALAVAACALPRGRIAMRTSLVLAICWVAVGTVFLWPGLGAALGLKAGVRAYVQLGFATLVVIQLVRQRRANRGKAGRRALAWVIGGLGLQAIALLLIALPLPALVLDLHRVVGLRAASVLLPFALVIATHSGAGIEVVGAVRRAVQLIVLTLVTALLALLGALVLPAMARALGFELNAVIADNLEPLIVLACSLVLTLWWRRPLLVAVDALGFPSRVHADIVVGDAVDALSDASTVDEVEWCVQRAALAAFGASATVLALDQPTLSERERLVKGESIERPSQDEAEPPVWLLPLRWHGELVGVATFRCADEIGLSPRQRIQVNTLAAAAGTALWRATRPTALAGAIAPRAAVAA